MKKIPILFATISLFLFSCDSASSTKANEQTETTIHEEQHHNEEMDTIELNDGAKWIVDAHMMTHIRNMENDVNSFATADQMEYSVLTEKLQTNLDLLTSNCTMKGKAHDELHKWLLPFIDLVKELSAAKDDAASAQQLKRIQISFSTFKQYFQ